MSKEKFFKRDSRGNKRDRKNKRLRGICPDGCGGFYPEHSFAEDGFCEICGYCLK